jgi:hypothetical protein
MFGGDDLADEDSLGLSVLFIPQVKVKRRLTAPKANHSSAHGRRTNWIKGEFVSGPLPLNWLARACGLPGVKTLATALAIWFEAGRRARRDNLNLTSEILRRFGVTNRSAKQRALEALEREGLISVERQQRKNPKVTILDVEV